MVSMFGLLSGKVVLFGIILSFLSYVVLANGVQVSFLVENDNPFNVKILDASGVVVDKDNSIVARISNLNQLSLDQGESGVYDISVLLNEDVEFYLDKYMPVHNRIVYKGPVTVEINAWVLLCNLIPISVSRSLSAVLDVDCSMYEVSRNLCVPRITEVNLG